MKYFLFFLILPFHIIMQTCNAKNIINESINDFSSDLEYLVREAKDSTVQAPVLILLHGYGSNKKDLFSFANYIPEHWLVVSVQAPISIAENQFKWYNVELINDKITMNFEDEEESRNRLLKLIDEIILKYNVDENKIVTAGFSQGANMAVGLALTAPEKIHAAACFSGRFMEEITPLIQNEKALKSKAIFISHGTKDQMLPMEYAEENKAILEAWEMKITLSLDDIGHSISNKQLDDFVNWIKLRHSIK